MIKRFLVGLLCGLLITSPASAAITAVAVAESGASAASGLTYSLTIPAGSDRLLIVCVSLSFGTVTSSGVTYNGTPMTLVDRQAHASTITTTEMWRLIAPTGDGAAHDVVVTLTGTVDEVKSGAVSFTDVHQTTPLGTAAKATDATSDISVAVSSATGEVVVDCAGSSGSSETFTVGSSQTEQLQIGAGGVSTHWVGASTEPGASTVTMSWAINQTQYWATVAAPLKPTAAIGGTPTVQTIIVE